MIDHIPDNAAAEIVRLLNLGQRVVVFEDEGAVKVASEIAMRGGNPFGRAPAPDAQPLWGPPMPPPWNPSPQPGFPPTFGQPDNTLHDGHEVVIEK